MKKILITGCLGYIGSVLSQYLEERGYDCIGYDTGFFRDCWFYQGKEPNLVIGDMRQFDPDLLKGVDTVVHLAGISNDPFGNLTKAKVYDPSRDYSLSLAKICRKKNIKFIFASSCSVYGKGDGSLLNENSPLYPQTPYSANKLEIEQGLMKIDDGSFSPIILRFATVFGLSPRIRFDVVVNMMTAMAFTTKKILLNSDGQAWRPFVSIEDVCKAIEHATDFDLKNLGPLVLNVGNTDQNHKIIDIAEMVKKCIGDCEIVFMNLKDKHRMTDEAELVRDRKIHDGIDSRTYRVSFEKIINAFQGYNCNHTVEDGIKSMIESFKEMQLTELNFKNPKYYRLQTMENLYNNKFINGDLYWHK